MYQGLSSSGVFGKMILNESTIPISPTEFVIVYMPKGLPDSRRRARITCEPDFDSQKLPRIAREAIGDLSLTISRHFQTCRQPSLTISNLFQLHRRLFKDHFQPVLPLPATSRSTLRNHSYSPGDYFPDISNRFRNKSISLSAYNRLNFNL